MSPELADDPLLAGVPFVDGYPVLEPCVLYRRLGQGGMGAVYLAHHTRLECEVAVKCLRLSSAHDEERAVQRFRREARLAAAVRHPNLVGVYDVLEGSGLHYMVLEYVHGETARERVRRKGALEPAEACAIVRAAAEGLAAAHERRIVHRDVKPDNVLISVTSQVKLADLGLAKALEQELGEPTATIGPVSMGTPSYMPPEQWEDAREVTPAADVYSLGAMLYFLLVGAEGIAPGSARDVMRRVLTEPFPDPRAARPELPEGLAALIADCTRKEAGERPADAADFLRRLAKVAPAAALVEAAPGDGGESQSVISPPPYRTILRATRQLEGGRSESDSKPGGVRVFRTACPACGEALALLPEHRGRRVRCKHCDELVRIPAAAGAAAPPSPPPARAEETVALTRTFERPARVQPARRALAGPAVWLFGGVLLAGGGFAVFGGGDAKEPVETPVAQATGSGQPGQAAPTPPVVPANVPPTGVPPGAPDPAELARLEQQALAAQAAVAAELEQRGRALEEARTAAELRTALDAAAETCRNHPEPCAQAGLDSAREEAAAQLARYDEMLELLAEVDAEVGSFEDFERIEPLEGPLSKMESPFEGDGVDRRVRDARAQLDQRVDQLARRAKGVEEEVRAVLAVEQFADAVEDPPRKERLRRSARAPLQALDARLGRAREPEETGELVVALAPRPERASSELHARWARLLEDLEARARDAESLEDALESLGELDAFAEALEEHAPESTGRAALLACGDPALERLDRELDALESALDAGDLLDALAQEPPASFEPQLSQRYDRLGGLVRRDTEGMGIKPLERYLRDLGRLGADLPEGELRATIEAEANALADGVVAHWEQRFDEAQALLDRGEHREAERRFQSLERDAKDTPAVWAIAKLGKAAALAGYAERDPQKLETARGIVEDVLFQERTRFEPEEKRWRGTSIAALATKARAELCAALADAWVADAKSTGSPRSVDRAKEAARDAKEAADEFHSRYAGEKGLDGKPLVLPKR